jgi:23S rRNA (guanosine2251-2'-O)-methyltransferase
MKTPRGRGPRQNSSSSGGGRSGAGERRPPSRFSKGPGGGGARGRPSGDRQERSFGDRKPRSFGDRPLGERSFGDRKPRSFGDRPQGERSFGDRKPRSFGDRPQGERSFGDRKPRSFGDRPQADRKPRAFAERKPRAFGDRPGGDRKPRFGDRPERKQRVFSMKDDQAPREAKAEGGFRQAPERFVEAPRALEAPEGSRFIYGINPVLEALRARADHVERLFLVEEGVSPRAAAEIFSRCRDAGIRVDMVRKERLALMADGGVHQGVVAEVRHFEYLEIFQLIELSKKSSRAPLLVVLDGIQDPGNLGAIIRSAHAFGADGVVIAKDRAAGVTGSVVKASAGATEHCPVARVVNLSRALEELKEAGFWSIAADPEGDRTVYDAAFDGPIALVIGSEGPGVRELVLKHCDFRVKIPMLGQVASLNASVSAGVLLSEVSRQRLLKAKVSPKPAPAS